MFLLCRTAVTLDWASHGHTPTPDGQNRREKHTGHEVGASGSAGHEEHDGPCALTNVLAVSYGSRSRPGEDARHGHTPTPDGQNRRENFYSCRTPLFWL